MTEFLAITGAGLALAALAWFLFWRSQARKLQTSGYIPPATSWFGKTIYSGLCWLVTFLTVGPVKVVGKENRLASGRVIYLANHQVPADFAVLYRTAGRHYRALGDAAQFPGIMGILAAWLGVISVTFKTKEERAAGEAAAVKVLSGSPSGPRFWTVLAFQSLLLSAALVCFAGEHYYLALLPLLGSCLVAASSGGEPALAIAPQGALMPDNLLKKEEFRAGAIRVVRAALAASGEPVHIVPVAIRYKRNPEDAHWTQRFLKSTRSIFLGMRNPRHWDPLFKTDLNKLTTAERQAVEEEQARRWKAYKHSQVTSYGAVAVHGSPINPADLPADPLEAIEVIRLKIAEMLSEASRH